MKLGFFTNCRFGFRRMIARGSNSSSMTYQVDQIILLNL